MGKVTTLWFLQEIDDKRKDLQWEGENSKIRGEVEKTSSLLKQKCMDLAKLTEKLGEIKREIRRGERESAGIMAEKEELEARLYSGQTTSLKELDQMQRKMTQLVQKGKELEEHILESMLEQEVLEGEWDNLSAGIKTMEGVLQEKKILLAEETEGFKSKLAALLTEREKLLGKVEKKWLRLYDDIAQRSRGQAVAAVVGDICLGCHISLPTNLTSRIITNERLQTCPSCGRILYYQGR